jgi:tetratricopeptide (TPR) repeat protein
MSLANLTKLKRKAADLEQKKQFEKALTLYIQIIDEAGRDLDDADLQLFNRVGDLLLRAGNASESLAYYEKAVDMYAERGFLNNAIALCNKILRQSPGRTAVYYKLGKISANKGFKSDAKKNFLEYADRMQKAGKVDEAFRALKEFADLCPDQDDIRLMLADLLTKENRSGEALEQLERLYHKLDVEGREAEARATLDRIKAIDPSATPRASGTSEVVRNNDLIFLDVGEVAARRRTPRQGTPIETPTVSPPAARLSPARIGALEGLTLTFLPTEDEAPLVEAPAGLEHGIGDAPPPATELPVVSGLERVETIDDIARAAPASIDADMAMAGLDLLSLEPASGDVPVTSANLLAAQEDRELTSEAAVEVVAPSGFEPTAVEAVEVHDHDDHDDHDDLPTPESSIAQSDPDDVTPDEWVSAALNSPRDNFHFDRLLTPLENALIPLVSPKNDESRAAPADPSAQPSGEAPERTSPDTPSSVDGVDPGAAAPEVDDSAVAAAREEAELVELSLDAAVAEAAAQAASFTGIHTSSSAGANGSVQPEGAPREFELEDLIARSADLSNAPALDLEGLRDAASRRSDERGSGVPDFDTSQLIQSAFEETAIELPMIDVGEEPASTGTAAADASTLDDLLSSTPSFGETIADPDFTPAPLNTTGTTDEWPAGAAPEVLIDGDWRDEHVGEFVSGEMHAVPPANIRRPEDATVFDDLTAAMMMGGDDEAAPDRGPTPASPQAFMVRGTPRGTLSFGGVEAHLRRRLELEPTNWSLKRLLGEALIDRGERETGLNVLDEAMRGFEGINDLRAARDVVDVILMVVPLSVRHHQKRVEYAVRANDRVQLVEAYAELADALFRCGEASKSRVVYTRVLELAPTFERARAALRLLPDGRERRRDTTGGRRGSQSPSVALATLRSGVDEDAMPTLEEALALPLLDGALPDESYVGSVPDSIDREIDSAFEAGQQHDGDEERAAASSAPTPPVDSRYVDLGSWLTDRPPARSTRMVADDVAPTGDEDADFQEMLRRFKRGLAENVEEDDYASHYDLGVAFKEMGLLDEAIAEFQKALRGEVNRVGAYESLGQCFYDKGQHQVAAALLSRALETVNADDQQLIGVLYLLGLSSEVLARPADAMRYYQRVFAVNVGFHDVAARLAAIERQST